MRRVIARVHWAGLVVLVVLPAVLPAQQPPESSILPPAADGLRPLPPIDPVSFEQADGSDLPPSEEVSAGPSSLEGLPPPPADDAAVAPKPPPKLWEGSFELGLNGTEGNSRTLNFRFGIDAKRKTPRDVFSVDLDYHKNTADYVETANRLYFDWRYEWLIEESRWTTFVHGTDDYDQFRPYDVRVTTDAGVGRKFIDTKRTSFLGRFGAGFAREIGGRDDRYVPELNFGLDLSHKINDRQKLAANMEYAPEVSDFEDCRINSKVSWEVLLDKEANLSLKVSIRDRYDSLPDNGEPNDIDYSTVLLWSF